MNNIPEYTVTQLNLDIKNVLEKFSDAELIEVKVTDKIDNND